MHKALLGELGHSKHSHMRGYFAWLYIWVPENLKFGEFKQNLNLYGLKNKNRNNIRQKKLSPEIKKN